MGDLGHCLKLLQMHLHAPKGRGLQAAGGGVASPAREGLLPGPGHTLGSRRLHLPRVSGDGDSR